ncbi:dehydrogenase/reductase SDR family member 7 isoform X2 [Oncorhynchus mykiss]|uniref:dehydrogenase/reductase SDR family member 7 isoform X2 n=1 Tax=Oncorhynchus mykiss TaxID=8022 RepID=UPI001878D6EF|nr:dehydrogenase/reductase SDR family member 7 isoform X2 [Oncorhynchus mykiss]
MDLGVTLLTGIALCLLVQFVCFLFADADLTLLWATLFGSKPETKLKGLVVWVTGASSGIGEELAYQLAGCGSRLILSARRVDQLDRVKLHCLERSNLKDKDILVLPLDLLERASHEAKMKTAIQHFGNIDILVNNGGRSQRSLCLETSVDVYQALMELNFLGTVSLTKQGFFNSLRTELTEYPRILISTVCPGPVQSQIVQNAFTEEVGKAIPTAGDQQHKMVTSRCVRLILVGIANGTKEMWIAQQPFLLFYYVWQYAPTWAWFITDVLGRKRVQNFKAGLDADSAYFTKPKPKSS